MAPKMLQKSSSGAGGLRESLRERLEAQEAPQRLPRARKLQGFALWDLQKSRFGQGLSAKNAAKPKDYTFSPTNTS